MSERVEGPNERRHANYDLVRLAATLAVVWLHVSADVVTTRPSVGSLDWWIGNIADSSSRWCVPVFVMLSGALLVPKSRAQTPLAFIRRRLPRLIFITLFWSLFYWFLVRQNSSLTGFVKAIALGSPYPHLWYMYLAIGLYAVAPLIQRSMDSLDDRSLRFFLSALFLVSMLSQIKSIVWPQPSFSVTLFAPYIGYFCVGHLATSRAIHISRSALVAVLLACAALISGLTGALLPALGEKSWGLMYDYLNPIVIVMSISLFLIALKLPYEGSILKLAPLTLGIYLLHPVVLLGLGRIGLGAFTFGPMIGIPLTTLVASAASALAAYLLKKTPMLRRLI